MHLLIAPPFGTLIKGDPPRDFIFTTPDEVELITPQINLISNPTFERILKFSVRDKVIIKDENHQFYGCAGDIIGIKKGGEYSLEMECHGCDGPYIACTSAFDHQLELKHKPIPVRPYEGASVLIKDPQHDYCGCVTELLRIYKVDDEIHWEALARIGNAKFYTTLDENQFLVFEDQKMAQ